MGKEMQLTSDLSLIYILLLTSSAISILSGTGPALIVSLQLCFASADEIFSRSQLECASFCNFPIGGHDLLAQRPCGCQIHPVVDLAC